MGIHLHHDHGDGHDQGHGPDHEHGHGHRHGPPRVSRALTRALIVTVVFMVVELVGGYLANSLALLSDAGHMLTDVGALCLSLFAHWMSKKPSTPRMSFGYHRAEILGALLSGLVIWLLAGGLIYEAVSRLQSPPEVKGPIVLGVALVGLLANLASMAMLHSSQQSNMNVRAAYLHLITDAMGSVGALVAGAVLMFTGWQIIDPIITLLVAALMLFSSWQLVRDAVVVLMESTPGHLDPGAVLAELQAIPGVREAHDLHIWTVASGRPALSVHLVAADAERVLRAANDLLSERYRIIHTTIQVEHPDHFQSERCYDCAHG
jgi:cobalt-zinc-cadmium efflux system protein